VSASTTTPYSIVVPETLITTLTLSDYSGSGVLADSHSAIQHIQFPDGMIPAGGAPMFKITSGPLAGTMVPFSYDLAPAIYPGGAYLRGADVLLRCPAAIAAGTPVTVGVYTGGTVPAPSGRSLSDITSNTNLNVTVGGLFNLTGTWVASVNQGITDAAANPANYADNYVAMDGDAGKVWMIRSNFQQAGANHGYFVCYNYIAVLQDSSGGFGAVRWLPKLVTPWYEPDLLVTGTNPTTGGTSITYLAFDSVVLNNGTTQINNAFEVNGTPVFGPSAAQPFTTTGGYLTTSSFFTTSSAFYSSCATGDAVKVASSYFTTSSAFYAACSTGDAAAIYNTYLISSAAFYNASSTGDTATISSTGTLPVPLTAGTTYYIIKGEPSFGILLATSAANAAAGISVLITSSGSGSATLTNTTRSVSSGVPVQLGGVLPSPLSSTTQYYIIKGATNEVALAASPANASAGIAVTFTTAGDPAITIADTTASVSTGAVPEFTATLPAPLSSGGTYYVIKGATNEISLATSVTNANAGVSIFLTSTTTGEITLIDSTVSVLSAFYTACSTGDTATISSTGTLPAPLVATTTYYIIKNATTNVVSLATSAANATAGTPIALTSTGTGTITLVDTVASASSVITSVASAIVPVNPFYAGCSAGDAATIASTGSVPAPLVAETTYYIVKGAPGEVSLASSPANASAGISIWLTSAGSGAITLTDSTASLTSGVSPVISALTLTSAESGIFQNWLVTVSGDNLPAGLEANTTYFWDPQAGTTSPDFVLTAFSNLAQSGLHPTSSGSGSVTPYQYITPFSAIFVCRTTDNRWNFLSGGGSVAADPLMLVTYSAADLIATQNIGPYDLTSACTSYPLYPYFPNTFGPLLRDTGTTGFHAEIGFNPTYVLDHLYHQTDLAQALIAESNVRMMSMCGATFAVCLRSQQYGGSLPCANNGHNNSGAAYPGMMPPQPSFAFPTNILPTNIVLMGVDQIGTSHMPHLNFYACSVLGGPEHRDILHEWGNSVILQGNTSTAPGTSGTGLGTANVTLSEYQPLGSDCWRNLVVPFTGNAYYGILLQFNQGRADGWALVFAAQAVMFQSAQNPSYNEYFSDVMAANAGYIQDLIASFPSEGMTYSATNGLWYSNNVFSQWEGSYILTGLGFSAYATGLTGFYIGAANMMQWYAHLESLMGGYVGWGYYIIMQRNGTSGTAPLVVNDDLLATEATDISWTSGSNVFVMDVSSIPYVPIVGDIMVFSSAGDGELPTAYESYVAYPMTAVTEVTALETYHITIGSAANTNSGSSPAFLQLTDANTRYPASRGLVLSDNAGSNSYFGQALGGMNFCAAYGCAAHAPDSSAITAAIADAMTRMVVQVPTPTYPTLWYADSFA
jgi:hypothetical protein